MKQPGTRLDFAKPHRKKQESTALPQNRNINGSETVKTAKKEVLQVQQATKGIKRTHECSTRYHDLGKHLGNDEQDTRSICLEKHGVEQMRRRQVEKNLQETKRL